MDLRQLTAVVTVTETGSVTRAAELLRTVQPAVSRQILALEHELGVTLFHRGRLGMQPTEAGLVLVDRARRALLEIERARAELTPDLAELSGIVTVGLLSSTTSALAERLVTALRQRQPGIRLRIMSGYSGHLEQWLDAGDLDLALLYDLSETPRTHVRPIVRENLWAVAPPDAGLDSERPVTLTEIAEHRLVLPAAPHGLRTLIDIAAERSSVSLDDVVETNSVTVQKLLVEAGHGWSILPGIAIATDLVERRLSAAPVHRPDILRTVALVTPHLERTPLAVTATIDELVRQIHRIVDTGAWPRGTLIEQT